MTYQPNFADARTKKRIQQAIGFACGCFSPTKPRQWSTRYIDQWFGQQQNALSGYLREQLLIVTNDHWDKDRRKCKEYLLNPAGVDFLSESIGIERQNKKETNHRNNPIVLQVLKQQYNSQLESGDFVYKDQSQRLWHPLQNFRKSSKRQLLDESGYQHHYDIECCAFNLIHQYSQQLPTPMDLYLEHMINYMQNRNVIRNQLAQEADVSPEVIKRIINGLLAGAPLSRSPTTQIYQMLQGDCAKIEFLQQHPYIINLRADIKICWDYIKHTLPRRGCLMTTGRTRMLGISSTQKWGVYFDLERQVLNEIRSFLRETDNKHFLEHDGWSWER